MTTRLCSPFCARCSHSETKTPEVVRIRRLKRFFAFGLFGGTLLIGLTAKRHRQKQQESILKDSKRLGIFGTLPIYEYKKCVLAEPVLKIIDKISAFSFREDDIVVLSFPKTGTATTLFFLLLTRFFFAGTTWIQEIVWLLENDLNFKEAEHRDITDRFPYLEFPSPGMTSIAKQHGKRFIKTHIPPSLLNLSSSDSMPRVVCIVRDPRDVVVSYFYFARMNNLVGFAGSFGDFFEAFIRNHVPYGPLDQFYADVVSLSKSPDSGHKVLVIRYEDLQQDFEGQVVKICSFLGRSLPSPSEMTALKRHCSFEEMQLNPSVNYSHWKDLGFAKEGEAPFMRKGVVGDWKSHFSPEQRHRFEVVMSSKKIRELGYQ